MKAIFCNFEKRVIDEELISIHDLYELKEHL